MGFSPADGVKAMELLNMAKRNSTLVSLAERLDGADVNEAYRVLKSLGDHELRVIAALIAEGNQKFGRVKSDGKRKAAVS